MHSFAIFEQFFPQLKNFFQKNLSVHIILVLDATLVLNLTFLGFFGPEISFEEKSHSPTQLISPSVNQHREILNTYQCYYSSR